MADLEKDIREIKRKTEGKEKPITRNPLISLPFAYEILAYKASREFKASSHTTYDGTRDLGDHLISFQVKKMVVGTNDHMLCRTRAAQRWFLSLLIS